jgi:hypothetical protein
MNKSEITIWNKLSGLFHIKTMKIRSVEMLDCFSEKYTSFISPEPPMIDDKGKNFRLDFLIQDKRAGINDVIELKTLQIKSTLSHKNEYYIRM